MGLNKERLIIQEDLKDAEAARLLKGKKGRALTPTKDGDDFTSVVTERLLKRVILPDDCPYEIMEEEFHRIIMATAAETNVDLKGNSHNEPGLSPRF